MDKKISKLCNISLHQATCLLKASTSSDILYQVVTDISTGQCSYDEAILSLQNNNTLWSHFSTKEMKVRLDEQDNFIENPFQVEEGIVQCKKCKSKRVFSHSKMCKSADEPMSVIAICCNCNLKWKIDT